MTTKHKSSVLNFIFLAMAIASFSLSSVSEAVESGAADQARDPASALNNAAGGAGNGALGGSKKKKSTEVSFDDVLVQGKYHFSDEAVTTVEDDKILDALLGVRTDFKDRIKKSTARQ